MSKKSSEKTKRHNIGLVWGGNSVSTTENVDIDITVSSRKLKNQDSSPPDILFRTHQYEFRCRPTKPFFDWAGRKSGFSVELKLLKKMNEGENYQEYTLCGDPVLTYSFTEDIFDNSWSIVLIWPDEKKRISFRGEFCFRLSVFRKTDENTYRKIFTRVSSSFKVFSKPEVYLRKERKRKAEQNISIEPPMKAPRLNPGELEPCLNALDANNNADPPSTENQDASTELDDVHNPYLIHPLSNPISFTPQNDSHQYITQQEQQQHFIQQQQQQQTHHYHHIQRQRIPQLSTGQPLETASNANKNNKPEEEPQSTTFFSETNDKDILGNPAMMKEEEHPSFSLPHPSLSQTELPLSQGSDLSGLGKAIPLSPMRNRKHLLSLSQSSQNKELLSLSFSQESHFAAQQSQDGDLYNLFYSSQQQECGSGGGDNASESFVHKKILHGSGSQNSQDNNNNNNNNNTNNTEWFHRLE